MSRRSSILFGTAPMLFLAGAAAALALLGFEAARAGGSATVTILVSAGKPSELKFTLSKKTAVAGSVVFKVVNRGKKPHSFAIAGKKTKPIAPGKTATLTVVFTKAGNFVYRSSLPGQAAMKGVFVVTAPIPTPVTTTPAPVCTGSSTVDVTLADPFRITLTQTSVPCGTVTFNVTNTGAINHNFAVPAGASSVLAAGGSTSFTVTITQPGTVTYLCQQGNHAGQGMAGTLTVT